MSLYGTGLSPIARPWNSSDFLDGQMPTSLTGVSVQLIGDFGSNSSYSAFVSYISPTQINILTPPNLGSNQGDDSTGYGFQVRVSNPLTPQAYLTNCSNAYDCPFVESASAAPAFFMLGSTGYAVAEHADGSLVAPSGAFPGSSPATRGETVVIYANGLGPTSGTITPGAEVQSGTLTTSPVVMIANEASKVSFAGLISPGLYQLNVTIPGEAPSGNDVLAVSVMAMIDGFLSPDSSLPTVLIAVGE